MNNPIRFIDRLDERGFIDRWGFVSFAFIGSILILLAKYLEVGAVWVAAGAVLLLLAYAWLVSTRGTAKLRSDQAGDNCYYLGLIYTLSSLAYAIFTFDPDNTATTIVQGFGIALATTIAGLVLRVFFSQSRVDLYETEDSARLELAQAAARLKTELSQIAVSFSDFGHQTQQIIAEMRDTALASIDQGAKRSIEAVGQVAAAAQEALDAQSSDLASKAKRLGQTTERVTLSMQRSAEQLDAVAASGERFAGVVENLQQAGIGARDAAEAVSAQLTQTSAIHTKVEASGRSLATAAERIERLVSETVSALLALQNDIRARLADLEEGPKKTVEGAFAGVSAAATQLEASVEQLLVAHRRSAQRIDDETTSLVGALKGHNQALEAELGRSRSNVTKVHGALVEMTDTLLEHVEQRAS